MKRRKKFLVPTAKFSIIIENYNEISSAKGTMKSLRAKYAQLSRQVLSFLKEVKEAQKKAKQRNTKNEECNDEMIGIFLLRPQYY